MFFRFYGPHREVVKTQHKTIHAWRHSSVIRVFPVLKFCWIHWIEWIYLGCVWNKINDFEIIKRTIAHLCKKTRQCNVNFISSNHKEFGNHSDIFQIQKWRIQRISRVKAPDPDPVLISLPKTALKWKKFGQDAPNSEGLHPKSPLQTFYFWTESIIVIVPHVAPPSNALMPQYWPPPYDKVYLIHGCLDYVTNLRLMLP